MADFGVSFVPGGNGDAGQGPGQEQGQVSGTPPLQQAIRMLSLRLPKFAGPGAIAPGMLLNAPGAMGMPGAGLNQGIPGGGDSNNALLEALMRLAKLHGGGGGGGMGSAPMGVPGGFVPPFAPPMGSVNPLPKIGPGSGAPAPPPLPGEGPAGWAPGPGGYDDTPFPTQNIGSNFKKPTNPFSNF